MVKTCHMCGSTVSENGTSTNGTKAGFECADCGKITCNGCKSIGVARATDHCQRCRG